MLRQRLGGLSKDERGFTLPEVLTVIAIMGILIAIAIIIWLGLLERWRVEAAANQVAADLRLAHSSATNQLTDWRVIFVPKNADDNRPDYYLVKLSAAYNPPGSPYTPGVIERTPRYLPDTVRIKNNKSGTANDNQGELRWTSPVESGSAPSPTRTAELNSDGTMAFFAGPKNSICVTVDENPMLRVAASYPVTSKVGIVEGTVSRSPCNES